MESWILVGIVLFLIFLIYSSRCRCRRGFSVGGRRGNRKRGRRSRREGRRNRGRGSRRRSGRDGDNTDLDDFSMETEIGISCPRDEQSNCSVSNCWNYKAQNWACGLTKKQCNTLEPFIWCSNSPSPPGPPSPGPAPPGPAPPSGRPLYNNGGHYRDYVTLINRSGKNIKVWFDNDTDDKKSIYSQIKPGSNKNNDNIIILNV